MVNSGVYKIENTETGKVYIGSSVNLRKRISQHLNRLKANTHENSYLQNSFNKHGELAFEFTIVEYVEDLDNLLEREQYWMDFSRSSEREYGFNMLPIVGNSKNMDEWARQKISNAHKGRKFSKEHRENLSKSQKKRWDVPGARKEMSDLHKKIYQEHPDYIIRMANTLKQRYIDNPELRIIASQKISGINHPGYGKPGRNLGKKMSQEQKNKIADSGSMEWIVISPEGIISQIKNLSNFCRENSLNSSSMVQVAKGKRKTHKGWAVKKLDFSEEE